MALVCQNPGNLKLTAGTFLRAEPTVEPAVLATAFTEVATDRAQNHTDLGVCFSSKNQTFPMSVVSQVRMLARLLPNFCFGSIFPVEFGPQSRHPPTARRRLPSEIDLRDLVVKI